MDCHVGRCVDREGHVTSWHCVDGYCHCLRLWILLTVWLFNISPYLYVCWSLIIQIKLKKEKFMLFFYFTIHVFISYISWS